MALDGKVTIDVCQQQITAKGDGKIVEVPVGGGETTYLWKDRAFKLKGKLDLEVSGYGFLGSISNSFFDVASKAFNVEASGALRFPGFTGGVLDGEAQAIVSSTGIAACFGKPDERVGIGQRWGEAIKPFALSCDLGPYRVSGAAARAAVTGTRFTVPRTSRVELVTAQGATAPPALTLTGPGATQITTPANGTSAQSSRSIVVEDLTARTTDVVLLAPNPGAWEVAATPGTAAPTEIRIADGLPPVRVSARVVHERHIRERLTWQIAPEPGQRVTFVELAKGLTRTLTRPPGPAVGCRLPRRPHPGNIRSKPSSPSRGCPGRCCPWRASPLLHSHGCTA